MPRFILQPHATKQGWWHCADTEHGIDVTFERHKFNETQQVTVENGTEFNTLSAAIAHARYLREMADWLRANHYNIAMPPMKK